MVENQCGSRDMAQSTEENVMVRPMRTRPAAGQAAQPPRDAQARVPWSSCERPLAEEVGQGAQTAK